MAAEHGLKRHVVNGAVEWHGPNPSGHGATHDGFILKEDGKAFERNGTTYSTRETAELFGIAPEQYAPEVEYRERQGHSRNGRASHSANGQHKASNPARPKAPAGSTSRPKAPAKRPKAPFQWERAHRFDYRDGGVILSQVGRCDAPGREKSISQRRPVDPACIDEASAGGWVYGLGAGTYNARGADFYPIKPGEEPEPGARDFPEARRVLYRRADVLDAATVHVCEGEKAADALNDALAQAGLYGPHVATTNPHGAGQWTGERGESYSADLAGKRVVFHPDNDTQGEQHLATACPSIARQAARLQVLRQPELPEKGDVADFLDAGGTVEELLELADAAPEWEAPAPTDEATGDEPGETLKAPRFQTFTLKQMGAMPRPQWLVRGLLVENTASMLSGDSGTFKSFTALEMALCVATGRDFHGREVKQGPVVYVAAEGFYTAFERAQAWAQVRGCELPANIYFLPVPVNVAEIDTAQAFADEIAELSPVLVILDTLSQCATGLNENSNDEMALFMGGMMRLGRELGAHVMALHHNAKGTGAMRGAGAIKNNADAQISMEKPEGDEQNTVFVRCEKQRGKPFEPFTLRGYEVELQGEVDEHGDPISSLVFEPCGDAITARKHPSTKRADRTRASLLEVFDALEASSECSERGGVKAGEWLGAAEEASPPICSPSSFFRCREKLEDEHVIEQCGRHNGSPLYRRCFATPSTPTTPIEANESSGSDGPKPDTPVLPVLPPPLRGGSTGSTGVDGEKIGVGVGTQSTQASTEKPSQRDAAPVEEPTPRKKAGARSKANAAEAEAGYANATPRAHSEEARR